MSQRKLHFSDDLKFPVDAATQTFAFIGRKRSGKTYGAGKMVEELLTAEVQCVILDTVGNWYGLRLASDGKGKGFDVPVFGGLRGDAPLNASAGALIADVVVDSGRSIVLDISQFNFADRKRFAADFGQRLWERKKAEEHPTPLHLVLEECQLIIPQFVGKDETRMVHVYEEIVRLGGNYGIGVSMITQRPQSVNKEALTQTECLVVFQINGVPERKAIKEWIVHQGADMSLLNELPSLPRGTAYVWSPQWLGIFQKVKVAAKITADTSSTPKVGQKTIRRDPAPLDMKDLEQRMAGLLEEAKANDPKSLRAEVARLKGELLKASARPLAVGKERRVEVAVLKVDQIKRLEISIGRIWDSAGRVGEVISKLDAWRTTLREKAEALEAGMKAARREGEPERLARVAEKFAVLESAPRLAPSPRPTPSHSNGDRSSLPEPQRKILTAIAQHNSGVGRIQLSVLTGYARSTRDRQIQYLKKAAFLEEDGDLLFVTQDGIAALGDYQPLPTGAKLREYWIAKLPEPQRRILSVAIDAYPKAVSRESIDQATGYARSTRDRNIQYLQARKLVSAVGRGEVVSSETLFD